jgi:hypothetical protein
LPDRFDLGGSDRKAAAAIDGRVVFSEEIAWDPYFQSDPQYHYDGINDSLKRARAHLPARGCDRRKRRGRLCEQRSARGFALPRGVTGGF